MTTFGIPKEVRDLELRVGLTPSGVLGLTQAGHTIYVERNAGKGAGFSDEDYSRAGAHIVYSADEAYGRCQVVVKVARPTATEHALFIPGQTIFSFFHLPVASHDLHAALAQREITAVAYERIEEDDGLRPVLVPASEVAGRMAPLIAGHYLRSDHGGRGVLLSGIPGIPPAVVVIVGAGVLGINAARAFTGIGAEVTVLDNNPRKLRQIDHLLNGRIRTMLASVHNLRRTTEFTDVLVGAVSLPGSRAPIVITADLVRRMKAGAIILDFAIDEGGCVETSRPTTLRDPIFIAEGVIHHCVPNVTASVARTTSYAISNAALPYLFAIGSYGLETAVQETPALARGIAYYHGENRTTTHTTGGQS